MRKLLAISVVLNLVLASLVVALLAQELMKLKPSTAETATLAPRRVSRPQEALLPQPPPVREEPRLDWARVHSDDPRAYFHNLQRAGCPEHVLRALVLGQINDDYRRQAIPLLRQMGKRYWEQVVIIKTPKELPPDSEETEARGRLGDLQIRRRELVMQLFGEDPWDRSRPSGDPDLRERRALMSFVPPEKLDAAVDWETRRSESIMAVYRLHLPQEQQEVELELTRSQLDDEAKRLFSPAEWQEYQLRTSKFSGFPGELYGVDLTEAEIRALVSIRKEDPQNRLSPATEQKIEALLGEERFQDFKRAQDEDFKSLYLLTLKLDLPEQAAAAAYAVKQAAEQAAGQMRLNPRLDEAALRKSLATLRSHAEARLTQHLGAQGLETLQRNGGGWLRQLEQVGDRSP
ncbi:MAG: hypothetical protein AB9869_13425 [Verrucomicrobiia bacterium]